MERPLRAGGAAGYKHQDTVINSRSEPAHQVMPRVHMVASLLKRWLDRHSPGWHPAPTSRRLPRRLHLPLQPPLLTGPWIALPQARPEQAVAIEPMPYSLIIGAVRVAKND